MQKIKYKYSSSIFFAIINILFFLVIEPSSKTTNFLLKLILSFTIVHLMSDGYQIIKENYEKKMALQIKRTIQIFGFCIIIIASAIDYFYSPVFAVIIALLLNFILISYIYLSY